jgi:elongation factor G
MAHRSTDLRNIVVFGQAGTGKTAFIDALAFKTHVINRHGDPRAGTSIGDTEPEEKSRKQTLVGHVFSFHAENDPLTLNVIDTPGHADFLADAYSSMHVADVAMMFVSADDDSLTYHARRLWNEAGNSGAGRAIVVTHPDAEHADFEAIESMLTEAFGDRVVPLTYPDGDGKDFTAVRDVLQHEGPRAATFRERLQERVAEADDALLEKYLDVGALTDAELIEHLPAAIAQGKVYPVLTVCPTKELGFSKFQAWLRDYFPSPTTVPHDEIEAKDDAPFVGRVFKVHVDPFVGRQAYVRCLSGKLHGDDTIRIARTGVHAKLHGLQIVEGTGLASTNEVVPGDLFVVHKIEDLRIGDTIEAVGQSIELPDFEYPEPVYSVAIEPANHGDEAKIHLGLERLEAEDPTFHAERNEETGELVVSGMSPLHVETHLERLERRYGVATTRHAPRVPFRETITTSAKGEHRHKKQTGGRGQFAQVQLEIRPLQPGEGFVFKNAVVGGSIPKAFIPEIEKGIRKAMAKGPLSGNQVVDIEVEVQDGKAHDVDSDQLSFQLAGARAFLDAFQRAKPILLEPIVELNIFVPERCTGDVSSSLSSMRGRLLGMEIEAGIQHVTAHVPLVETQDYSTRLRSMSAGEGTFTIRASHFEPVPSNVQSRFIEKGREATAVG